MWTISGEGVGGNDFSSASLGAKRFVDKREAQGKTEDRLPASAITNYRGVLH